MLEKSLYTSTRWEQATDETLRTRPWVARPPITNNADDPAEPFGSVAWWYSVVAMPAAGVKSAWLRTIAKNLLTSLQVLFVIARSPRSHWVVHGVARTTVETSDTVDIIGSTWSDNPEICSRVVEMFMMQVENTGNVRLSNATVLDASTTLSCDTLPEILEPGASTVCSGSSVLFWAAIEDGGINTTSRWAPIKMYISNFLHLHREGLPTSPSPKSRRWTVQRSKEQWEIATTICLPGWSADGKPLSRQNSLTLFCPYVCVVLASLMRYVPLLVSTPRTP